MQRFKLILQKLHHNHFFGPLLAGGLFKIPSPTKNFLKKFFVKMHRFRHIHQKLNQKVYFRPLFVARLFKIQFPTKNFLRDFSLKCRDFDLFTKNYIITIFSDPFWQEVCSKFHSLQKFLREIFH